MNYKFYSSVSGPVLVRKNEEVMDKIQAYIQRRVRELVAAQWSDADIVRQLEAVGGHKLVVQVVAEVRQLNN